MFHQILHTRININMDPRPIFSTRVSRNPGRPCLGIVGRVKWPLDRETHKPPAFVVMSHRAVDVTVAAASLWIRAAFMPSFTRE